MNLEIQSKIGNKSTDSTMIVLWRATSNSPADDGAISGLRAPQISMNETQRHFTFQANLRK